MENNKRKEWLEQYLKDTGITKKDFKKDYKIHKDHNNEYVAVKRWEMMKFLKEKRRLARIVVPEPINTVVEPEPGEVLPDPEIDLTVPGM